VGTNCREHVKPDKQGIAVPEVIDIEGSVNLRDFGGYQTVDGERVKSGVLYRSGMMMSLDEQGKKEFLELDVSVICDLRHHTERSREPTPFPPHAPRQVLIPLDPGRHFARVEADPHALHAIETLETDAQRVSFMKGINMDLARDHAADYRLMFDELLNPQLSGFLVHCSAGKDRTGFGVGIILLALGVDRETVMQDYMLTNSVMNFEKFNLPRLRERFGEHITLDDAVSLSGVRHEYLSAALDEVDRVWGTFADYLEQGIGLNSAQQAQLKHRFLE